MKSIYLFPLVGILAIGLIVIGFTAVVVAGPPEQEPVSSASGAESSSVPPASHRPEGNAPDENGYTGDPYRPDVGISEPSGAGEGQTVAAALPVRHAAEWPDENGYVGPPYLGVAEAGGPSATGPSETLPPDWDRFFAEPQPDQDAYYQDQSAQGVSGQWSSFYYLHVAGSALRPRASATGWASSVYGGCIYATSGAGEVFNIHLDLPHGSRADYLRIYYYDTNSADSEAWITCYNDIGGFNDRIAVASSGTGGYGTQLSGYLGEVFDYASYSYVLNWRPNVAGTTMWLCGLRVAYRLPD